MSLFLPYRVFKFYLYSQFKTAALNEKVFKLNSFFTKKEFIKGVRRNPSFFFYLGEWEWKIRRLKKQLSPIPIPLKKNGEGECVREEKEPKRREQRRE